jgi:ADP-ribose pyrophosphatase
MPLQRWKKLSESLVSENPWWRYKHDRFLLPNGKEGEYHYVQTNGSSMVVPLDNEGKILLVNQYRYLLDRESLELPCGSVKDGSSYEKTAAQELEEETGFAAGRLELIGVFNPYNGVTDEMCNVYLGSDLKFVGARPDDTEEFELKRMLPAEIDEEIGRGAIWDGMTIAAWAIAKPRVS